MFKINLIILLIIFNILTATHAEVFSSLAGMESLLQTEGEVIRNLEDFIDFQMENLNTLDRILNYYKEEHAKALQDVEKFVGIPMNSYLLTKRLSVEYEEILQLVRELTVNNDFLQKSNTTKERFIFPEEKDYNGAIDAILRLQETYDLDPQDLSQGIINKIDYGVKLSVADTYEISHHAFKTKNYYYSNLWLKETSRQLDVTDDPELIDLIDELWEKLKLQDLSPIVNKFFNDACKGELKKTALEESQLHCRYYKNDLPFLTIAPFKVEEANLDPLIVVFHDVISDDEIAQIKKAATPKFIRATVVSDGNSTKQIVRSVTSNRVSQCGWLDPKDYPVVATLTQRIRDMTGLNMESSEILQVGNYGIGGHYYLHRDYFTDLTYYNSIGLGNRISTLLFYMSDVEQGGATIFPIHKVLIKPKKGTAAFWFNLHRDGEPDSTTLHAACPVLVGSKWVANSWNHERRQEFTRPCGLEKDSPPEEEVERIKNKYG